MPVITISGSIGSLPPGGSIAATSQIVFSQKLNNIKSVSEVALAPEQAVDFEALREKEKQAKADAIDVYFRAREMPLSGFGMKMVEEAERNELDWRLLPAIAARESTGGKNKTQFSHLHTHSHYSLLDGLAKIDDLVSRAKELGMTLPDEPMPPGGGMGMGGGGGMGMGGGMGSGGGRGR